MITPLKMLTKKSKTQKVICAIILLMLKKVDKNKLYYLEIPAEKVKLFISKMQGNGYLWGEEK